VRVAGWAICARCLGMYPPLLLGLALLFGLDVRGEIDLSPRPFEGTVLILGVLPALVDWVRGRLRPEAGTNAIRLLTGGLLGLALARTIHLQGRAPFEPPAVEVLFFLVVAVGVGEILYRALR
jgi:uncharacterized membrane protein